MSLAPPGEFVLQLLLRKEVRNETGSHLRKGERGREEEGMKGRRDGGEEKGREERGSETGGRVGEGTKASLLWTEIKICFRRQE